MYIKLQAIVDRGTILKLTDPDGTNVRVVIIKYIRQDMEDALFIHEASRIG